MEKVQILSGGIETIGLIAAEWSELCNEGASATPFLRPEWFTAFVSNFEKRIDLLTVIHDDKLRAVLPLVQKRASLHGFPVRKLQAVFNLNTQRFDLIHGAADETERKAVVASVWKAIRNTRGWDVMEIRLARNDSWLVDVLAIAEADGYPVGTWQMDSAPYITLPVGGDKQRAIDDFFKGPRKHLKQELNRRLRRLNELGKVEFVTSTGFSPELMQTYFDLETRGWKGRGGTAATDDARVARLHGDFARAVADKHSLFVYELKLDGKTIAMSMNIRYGGETIHWKTSYDEDYARYSPGNILFRQLVIDSIKNGSPEIDFLSPATPNKRAWATGEREHVAFYIFRRGLIGSLLWHWKFFIIGGLRTLRSAPAGIMVLARDV